MSALNITDLNNAKTDVDHIAAVANSPLPTAVDRLGRTKDTLEGKLAQFDSARAAKVAEFDATVADAESDLNVYRAQAATSAGQAATSAGAAAASRAAVDNRIYPGTYASDPTTRPDGSAVQTGDEYFNATANLTKRYNGATWVASDINTANLAASSGASLIGDSGTTVADRLSAVNLADYAALRAYVGGSKTAYVTGYLVTAAPSGVAGLFTRDDSDTTSADNGGTIIVASNGKRWKRVFSGSVNVKWFGATGDGGTDDTTEIVAAITAHDTINLPPGTYIFGNSSFSKSVRVVGAGKGATTIKWKASSAESSLFKFTGASPLRVEFENLTIDGNKANQTDSTGYYASIEMDSAGGSTLILNDVRFINGRIQDVIVDNQDATPTHFHMQGCEFSGGMEGTLTRSASYVQVRDNVVVLWMDNRATMPSGGTIGRAGFLHQRAGAAAPATAFGKMIAHGNQFENVGRGGLASDTLGCIDLYGGGDLVSIQGNTSKDSLGRVINVKADSGDIVILGNTCINHAGAVAAITFFDQQSTYTGPTSVGRNLIIANNVVRNTTTASNGKGIQIDGDDTNAADHFANVIVQGNVLDGTTQYAIYARRFRNGSFLGNKIASGARGIFIDDLAGILEIKGNSFKDLTNSGVVFSGASVSTADAVIQGNTFDNADTIAVGLFNPVNSFVIKGNVIRGCTTAIQTAGATAQSAIVENDIQGETVTWAKSGTYGLLDYRDNLTTVGPSFTIRTLTIASGAVTPFGTWHVVDTEGAAATDDLDTVNGGFDGRRLTLFAANDSRDVVLKDSTGNLRLNGDFTLTNQQDSITLMYRGTAWYEISRSDNAV